MSPWTAFLTGLRQGLRVSWRAYFAPLVAVWRLLRAATEEILREK